METGSGDSPFREVKEDDFVEGWDFHLTLDKLRIGLDCIVRRRTYKDMTRVKRAGTYAGYYAFEVDAKISEVHLKADPREIIVDVFGNRGIRVQGDKLIVDEYGLLIENNVGDLRDKEEPEGWRQMGYLLATQPSRIEPGSRLAIARRLSEIRGQSEGSIRESDVA